MNREFAPYEPSLNLKELGFDEPCFRFFYSDGRISDNLENDIISKDYINTRINGYSELNSCSAPTFSQAFRWFREKHKLYHTINMFGDWDKPQYSYLVSGRTMNNPAHMWYFEDKDSHEEAELACLIKLIEIVKNK
jgi:hypothetical protein